MKKLSILSLSGLLITAGMPLFAQQPIFDWALQGNGNANERAWNVTSDMAGNVYVTGIYDAAFAIGPFSLPAPAGSYDIFIAKYAADGTPLWVQHAGSSGQDMANSIKVDAAGNVYVAGTFPNNITLGGAVTLVNAGGPDVFLTKLDGTNGNILWANGFGGNAADIVGALAVDAASGDAYIAGQYASSSLTIGTHTFSNAGALDVYITKFDASGGFVWSKSAGNTGLDEAGALGVDASGDVYLAGRFTSADIAFGSNSLLNTQAPYYDNFLVKYDASGNELWAASTGGTADDVTTALVTDASGNVYIAGRFNSSALTFGSTILTNAGSDDIFIAKYDGSGSALWAVRAGGADIDVPVTVDIDLAGNVYVAGYYHSPSFNIGTTTLTRSAAARELFFAQYSASGAPLWAMTSAGGGNKTTTSMAVHRATGNAYLVGYFTGTAVFGGTTLTATNADFFLVKFKDLPLSVELSHFIAREAISPAKGALLSWTTATENNNRGFEIERSRDGRNWIPIGYTQSLAADGNSKWELHYAFTDPTPSAGHNYYRLKQTDFDGKYEYSPVRMVYFDSKVIAPSFSLYPNPASNKLFISGITGISTVSISNISGQVINTIVSENETTMLSLQEQSSGVYIISITDANGNRTDHKITKQ